jgi:archaeosortase A (PGF-CTERM-specific)
MITKNKDGLIASLFIILPLLFVIIGLVYFNYPIDDNIKSFLSIPLFSGLIFLGLGFLYNSRDISKFFRLIGWIIFSFYWATQPNSLYFGEDGDIVNAFLCILGIFILFYFSYHEWISIKRNEKIISLNWAAGAASLAGILYFIIELTPLATWLIEVVTVQSAMVLNLFTGNVETIGTGIKYNGIFVVNIIFACTAVQSMVLFLGMIIPLEKVNIKRKIIGLLITVVPIYFLNLIRNASITYLLGEKITDFYIAHNIIGKGSSLIALVLLLFILIKIVPEVFDCIIELTELPKRYGPIEKFLKFKPGVKR